MREVCLGALMLCLLSANMSRGQDQQDQTTSVLAAMRDALGGEVVLDAIRTVRGIGQTSRNVGPLRIAGAIELQVALPDRYLRIDRLAIGGMVSEVAAGFRGDALLGRASGPGGVRIDPVAGLGTDAGASAALVLGSRQDVTRLLLGFFGASPMLTLEFAHAGVAEAPDGTADLIVVRGRDGFDARFFVDTATHLPLMVAWSGPDIAQLMRALSDRAPGDAVPTTDQLLAGVQGSVEHRLYFSDYRPVDALVDALVDAPVDDLVNAVRWPFRISRSVAGETVEELVFDRFLVNPDLDLRAFDPDR